MAKKRTASKAAALSPNPVSSDVPCPSGRFVGAAAALPEQRKAFRTALLAWYDENKRDLPWRGTTDLYRVWLSEIMLQQTQVQQVIPYYEQFVRIFPSLETLAAAELQAVLLTWEGLGYYARARNLHKAARQVVASGQLPTSFKEFQILPGIGPYTARAIASIVYGEAEAVVDGNVRRVIARLGTLENASTAMVQTVAERLLDQRRPGDYNQALMELGALICTPRNPACNCCPVAPFCQALASGTPEAWPVRRKKRGVPHFDIAVGILSDADGRVFIQQRPDNALLGGLWELPGGKREPGEAIKDTCRRELQEELGIAVAVGDLAAKIKHAYTHFRITLWAFHCRILDGSPVSAHGLPTVWVRPDQLKDYPFPRANRRILDLLSSPAETSS